jgi:hypothetical protein
MAKYREIRADYDRDTIVVYQAYRPEIADAAVRAGRFVPPFSFGRMTWIKPSFLWLMERSNWGRKSQQERILAVRIARSGWEEALSMGELTSFESLVHGDFAAWQSRFASAVVHVQWDPERSLRGQKLEHRAIQVGLSRHIIRRYTDDWTTEITDITPLVQKILRLCEMGQFDRAKKLLPREHMYDAPAQTEARLGMSIAG